MYDYNYKKILEATNYLNNLFNEKKEFYFNDIFKLLCSFGYTKVITIDEIADYISSGSKYIESIFEFSKGYILDNSNYRIYAVNEGPFFNIFIISLENKKVNSYFCNNITNFTMDILFKLEVLKQF